MYRYFLHWRVGHFHEIQTLDTNTKFIFKTSVGGTAVPNFRKSMDERRPAPQYSLSNAYWLFSLSAFTTHPTTAHA